MASLRRADVPFKEGYSEGFKEGFQEGEKEMMMKEKAPYLERDREYIRQGEIGAKAATEFSGIQGERIIGTERFVATKTTGAAPITSNFVRDESITRRIEERIHQPSVKFDSYAVPMELPPLRSTINENPAQLEAEIRDVKIAQQILSPEIFERGIAKREVVTHKVVHPTDFRTVEHVVKHPVRHDYQRHVVPHEIIHEVIHEVPHVIHHEVLHEVPHEIHHQVEHQIKEIIRHKTEHDIRQDVHHSIQHDVRHEIQHGVTKVTVQESEPPVIREEPSVPHTVTTVERVHTGPVVERFENMELAEKKVVEPGLITSVPPAATVASTTTAVAPAPVVETIAPAPITTSTATITPMPTTATSTTTTTVPTAAPAPVLISETAPTTVAMDHGRLSMKDKIKMQLNKVTHRDEQAAIGREASYRA